MAISLQTARAMLFAAPTRKREAVRTEQDSRDVAAFEARCARLRPRSFLLVALSRGLVK